MQFFIVDLTFEVFADYRYFIVWTSQLKLLIIHKDFELNFVFIEYVP